MRSNSRQLVKNLVALGTLFVLAVLAVGCGAGTASPTATPVSLEWVVTTLAGSGRHGPLGGGYADGPALQAQFHEPISLAVDGAGNVYVSDWVNHRIRRIAPDGTVSTVAGGGLPGPRGDYADGRGEAARFFGPEGLALDAQGNLYVADSRNNRIRRIAPYGTVSTVAGGGSSGLLGGYVDGPADQAHFALPLDVAVDAAGYLYVTDFLNHAIRRITPAGHVTTLAGNGQPGDEDGVGQAASFELPNRIAIDRAGNLYVTEGRARDFGERLGGNRVRKITPDGRVTTLAGTGEPGYRDGPAAEAQFDIPEGVAVDEAGNVYVADTGNSYIRCIGTDGLVTTVAGVGVEAYADGPAGEAAFWYPMDVAVAPDGSLLVADWRNHRIRRIVLR